MSHLNFSRLALTQDIKRQRELIALYTSHLARPLTADERDFCEKSLAHAKAQIAKLRNTSPLQY